MVCLEFSRCSFLTDAILDKMKCFPLLQYVDIQLTSVTKEGSLEFLLQRRFGRLKYFAVCDVKDQAWIEAQLASRGIKMPNVVR